MFWKKKILNKLMEFYWNFAISQNWGCGGQGCYFWPNPRVISKKSAIQDSQITFKLKLACIFLPARAKWNINVCVDTPCKSTKYFYRIYVDMHGTVSLFGINSQRWNSITCTDAQYTEGRIGMIKKNIFCFSGLKVILHHEYIENL